MSFHSLFKELKFNLPKGKAKAYFDSTYLHRTPRLSRTGRKTSEIYKSCDSLIVY